MSRIMISVNIDIIGCLNREFLIRYRGWCNQSAAENKSNFISRMVRPKKSEMRVRNEKNIGKKYIVSARTRVSRGIKAKEIEQLWDSVLSIPFMHIRIPFAKTKGGMNGSRANFSVAKIITHHSKSLTL